MFTGIVQGCFPVVELKKSPGLISYALEMTPELVDGLKIGASVANDGVCLTAIKIEDRKVWFDVMDETLVKTTLGQIEPGRCLNIERSAKMGDEIGGHFMSGHIVSTVEVVEIEKPDNNCVLTVKVPQQWTKYLFEKGFVGLDGCSLTITDLDKTVGTFKVWLIPETLRLTGFGKKAVGDKINLELDSRTQTIVDTVEEHIRRLDLGNRN